MAEDGEEAQALRDNMEALQATVVSTGEELERLDFLISFMQTAHADQLAAIDALIQEASDVREALMQARALIAEHLQAQASGVALIQTASGASLTKKLAGMTSTYKGYATLALEFMELASNRDIVSDQGMVAELLAAFDELINQVNQDMTNLQKRRGTMVTSFETDMAPVAEGRRKANADHVAA